MLLFRGRTALRQLCVCVLLIGAASGAHAAEPVAADDGAINLDQAVQALKDEAIQFNRDALMAEEAFLFPPQTRVAVYVSNRIGNLLLREISVTLDTNPPVTYRYDEVDSRALTQKGSMQRLVLTNLSRGPHRLQVAFSGRYMDGDEEIGSFDSRYEAVFDKGLDPAELELEILRGPRKGTPAMKLKEWRAAEE